jgi:hypothetical protein
MQGRKGWDSEERGASQQKSPRGRAFFLLLQICYSTVATPYLAGLRPIIPPPELQGDGYLQWEHRSLAATGFRLVPWAFPAFLLHPK